jgi:NAD(P)H-dependent FMN reductase
MKSKTLAFGASGSKNSINQIFSKYVAKQLFNSYETLDLSQFHLPIYTVDEELENGLPETVETIYNHIKNADVIIISLAEHNGSYTAFFKNIFDWLSRKELKFFTDKKLILTATAPGPRGGQGVLDTALERFPKHGATILGHFVLPKYRENYNEENGIIDQELKMNFDVFVNDVRSNLLSEV